MEKEKFDIEAFPTSESALRMLRNVTQGFYDNSYVGKWLYQVMGLEYDEARNLVEELPLQMFPETATWGLMYHEIKWQLPVRNNLSYEERRQLIYQKRDCRAPMTPYRMETYLKDATGFEVRIADVNDLGDYGFVATNPNMFKTYFVGEGTLNSKKVRGILNYLKQSHTTYIINDRVILEIDNRIIEVFLRNIVFKMQVSFWDTFYFDGTWLMDGSIYLNAKRRYKLALYVNTLFYVNEFYQNEVKKINFKANAYLSEMITAKEHYLLILPSEDITELKANAIYRTNVIEKEETIVAVIETKTPDYWFFDGMVQMDGSRKMNAIYKKEAVE